MGNASLLLAIAAIFSLTVASSRQNITFLETEDVQADYEEQVLAREIATSWLSVEAARLKNDFEGYRLSKLDEAYNDGFYDVDITQSETDRVRIIVNGFYGEAGFQYDVVFAVGSSTEHIPEFFASAMAVGGNIDFDSPATIRAAGLNNSSIRSNQNINFNIGTSLVEGFGWYYQGINVSNGQSATGIFNPVSNPDGDPVTEQKPEVDIPVINTSELKSSATQSTDDNLYLSGAVALGTASNPKIWYVGQNMITTGDIEFSGYGMFLVAQNIEFLHNTSMSESGGSVMFLSEQNIEIKAPLSLTGNLMSNENIKMDAPVTLNGSLTTRENWKTTSPLTLNYLPPSASITDRFWNGDTTVYTNSVAGEMVLVSVTAGAIVGRASRIVTEVF